VFCFCFRNVFAFVMYPYHFILFGIDAFNDICLLNSLFFFPFSVFSGFSFCTEKKLAGRVVSLFPNLRV